MMVPNNGDETISVIDVTRVVTTLQGGAGMTVVNYTQGGKMPMSSAGKRAPSVYDMATFKRVNRLKLGANLSLETGATTADGRKIYGASSTDDLVYVIDSTDQVKRIANIGRSSWGVTIWGLDITSDLAFLIFLGILNMDFLRELHTNLKISVRSFNQESESYGKEVALAPTRYRRYR